MLPAGGEKPETMLVFRVFAQTVALSLSFNVVLIQSSFHGSGNQDESAEP
jgi:hypothetical protein